jgi:hypothetical protein
MWTFVVLVTALVAFGVAPRPLVDSRFAASDDILRLRQVRMLGRQNVQGTSGHPARAEALPMNRWRPLRSDDGNLLSEPRKVA